MKYLLFLLSICMILACSNEEEMQTCIKKDYNQEFQIRLGDSVCFPDGNSFEVKVISDEFCCCLCLCAWEGELEILVETTNQNGEKDLLSFGSSTYELKDFIFEGYKVSKIDYLYKGEPNSLPLCEGIYDSKEVELNFEVSPI